MKRIVKIISFIVVFIGIILLTSCGKNTYSARKVSKIELGDTKVEVEEILGSPYGQDATYYEYFSKNYIKLNKKNYGKC